ncbi:hypothetical protein D7319_03605 [Streptomyces radicis]|uniref:Uncharacterized protein n=1 Tax=Streptomyces radicis TaxID=1750517 RepID=A0A3A9WHC6_9ACTN|nr:hypothetical protein D7319_03605 [Streptomyces radicis]RKN25947.1 hypothetical protein D7318_06875 [Streptomyces radicis]
MDTTRTADAPDTPDEAAAARVARFGQLPPRVDPGDLVEESPVSPPADPSFGRNPETDWMLRYAG